MEAVFIKALNIGITASYLVILLLLLRPLFKKAPKWLYCCLWAIVGLRLLMPVSIESIFSLIPNAKPIPDNIAMQREPAVNSGISFVNTLVNPVIGELFAPEPAASANPLQILLALAGWIWVIGIALMLLYGAFSYFRVRRRTRPSVRTNGNVYLSDGIDTPFILGILRPRIFLPSTLDENAARYVIAHERAHLARRDHLIKPLGFLLLSLYWFHPLLWVAYFCLCRDIEGACDERVIRNMPRGEIKGYSQALLSCSLKKPRMLSVCPLAFGEVGVKERIQSVLHYKKPTFWVILVSVILLVVLSVAFLTDPLNDPRPQDPASDIYAPSYSGVELSYVKETYPEYFDLDASDGLTVYVWQMAAQSFSCGLLAGDIRDYDNQPLWRLKGTTIDQMKAILSTYEIAPEKITLVVGYKLYSSYIGNNTTPSYLANLYVMFELDPTLYTLGKTIDTARADIDGDGVAERLVLANTATEQNMVALGVYAQNGNTFRYYNIIADEHFDLSFETDSDGKLYIRAVCPDDGNVYVHEVSVHGGNVYALCQYMPIGVRAANHLAGFYAPEGSDENLSE